MRTATVPESDLSTDVDREPSVLSDMGQVERGAPATPNGESQSMTFLDIASPDEALSPSESAGVAAGIVVSREELALDRIMDQTYAFALDSTDAIPAVAQDKAVAQGDTAAAAGPSTAAPAAEPAEASGKEGQRPVSSSWRQRAASGVAVMLFAFNQVFAGKRCKEDDNEQPSRKAV